jgi:solute carrier family 25 carnitine/acylcarnitine transporter 20/29
MTEGWWVDFAAGWVSGAVSVVTCQPLDTILTRFQAGQGIGIAGTTAATTATATNSAAASGSASGELGLSALGSGVRGLAREFGVGSLWRGSSPMIGVVPFQNALLMGGYGFGKQYTTQTEAAIATAEGDRDATVRRSSYWNRLLPVFVGGCAGGVLQSFLVSPVEWIKVHQQTAARGATSTSTSSLLKTLFRHKYSLWNLGLTATLLRDGIPHGVWFASYEYCKVELLQLGKNHGDETDECSSSYYESVAVPLISGAFSATTAWVSRIESSRRGIVSRTILFSTTRVFITDAILFRVCNNSHDLL